MGQEDHTLTRGKKGSRFTAEPRTVLEWLGNGKGGTRKERSPPRLAALLGKSRRRIYRELTRGMTEPLTGELETIPSYRGELAQAKAAAERLSPDPAEKLGYDHPLADAIAVKSKTAHYSPYAVQARFAMDGWSTESRLCAKTIYRSVATGMRFAVTEADLPRGGRRRKKGGKPPVHSRKGAVRRSIAARSEAADNRSEAGHGEMDTVKGPQNDRTDCLLTLTERKTRAQIIRKLPDGKAASVVAALDALEEERGADFSLRFKSVTDEQRDVVIKTVRKGFPLNVMYWVKNEDGCFEVLDGQQRSISICEYVQNKFSIDYEQFDTLAKDEQEQVLDYELMVYFCEGAESEKLDWFKTVNIAGAVLTKQELRNAVYTGSWLSDAKKHFSKSKPSKTKPLMPPLWKKKFPA